MTSNVQAGKPEWPSIDDHHPDEEGGPTARAGLSYQDEVVVGLFLDMVADESILRIHCETHDDVVVKRLANGKEVVEYVQVKSNEPDKLWSVADMCSGGADSVCAKSLTRDRCKEDSRFRIVTLRDVTSELKLLTYPCYGPGRECSDEGFTTLSTAVME
jgi:hypothetical protein